MIPAPNAEGPSSSSDAKAVKSISLRYAASNDLCSLFEDFRLMCNDAIRIALAQRPKGRFELQELAYTRLKEYGLHSHYVLSACEVAYSVYKNKNRRRIPYIKKAFLKLDNQSYKLDHLLLRIPVTPRRFVFLTLEGSEHHRSTLDDPTLKMGSITITERTVSIPFSKVVTMIIPKGYVGIDVNERNVTVSATNGYTHAFTELAEITEIKERYREIRAKIGMITRQDNRIGRQLYAKYGRLERHRTSSRIHKITKKIVDIAKENHFGIKIENLTGITRLYRKGNGQGPNFRGRMNTWVFWETQRQTEYKAAWLGVPVYRINPRGTSSNCPDCGSRVVCLQDRKLYCEQCDKIWDRDDLASRNIMACVVPQARPLKGSSEKEPRRQEDAGNPLSRWEEAKLGSSRRATS